MKKIYFVIILLTLYGSVFGQLTQFRMIGSGTWTTVNDSTFSSTVTIQADLTANGFLPTGIVDSMKVFTQTGQRYRISSVSNKTFSSADLVVVESGGNWGSPVGQVLIYETRGRSSVPSIPFSATGATAKMQEAADTYNSSLIVEGIGDVTTAQLADSTAAIRADLSPVPADTIRSIVYAPAHGYTLGSFTASIIAVKNNYETANATHLDSIQYLYVVGVPDVDSLEVKGTGEVYRPSHGLTIGSTYYLQNTPNSSYGLTPGTVSSPVLFVLDSDNILLLGQGATAKEAIPRKLIPASIITSFGGEPFAPHDTVIQNIAEVFAANGTITPPTILITQSSGSTRNPVHQGATGDPSTPANSWLWDGALVTRLSYATVSVSMQDTVWGTLFDLPLDTVELIAGVPTDSTVADWLETNYTTNGLRLKNGDMMYWGGTKTSPDYIWEVVDDLNTISISGNNWDKIVKRIKQPSGGFTEANTFYIDPNGNNATGTKGRADKPFTDPWAISSLLDSSKTLIVINPGTYKLFDESSDNSHVFLEDSVTILAYGATVKIADVDASSGTTFMTDNHDGTNYHPVNLILRGGDWLVNEDAAPYANSFYIAHENSSQDIDINLLKLSGGRVFGFYGNTNTRARINKIESTGGIAVSVQNMVDSLGVATEYATRQVDIEVGVVEVGGSTDQTGVIRFQSGNIDSLSNIRVSIGGIKNLPLNHAPFGTSSLGLIKSSVDYEIKGSMIKDNISFPPREGIFDGTANIGAMPLGYFPMRNSNVRMAIENYKAINGPVLGSYNAEENDTIKDNSTLLWDFGKIEVDTGTTMMIDDRILRNGGKYIIDCENCINNGSPIMSIWDIDADSSSKVIIKGNYTVNASKPVIFTRAPVYLEGNFTNDGTVAAIQSDVPTTVYVSGAFNTNSIILDPDVTIVRLNEYGAGGDGNGIYTGSDTLISEVTSVKMNMQGDQNFLIGKFGEFGYDGTENEAGLFIDPYNWGGVGLANSNGTNYGYYYISDNGRQDFYSSTSGGSISLILGSPDSDSGVTFSKNTSSISSSMGVDVRRGGFNLSRPGVGFSAGIRHSYKAGDLSIARLGNNVPTVERFKHNFVVTLAVGGIAKTTFRIGPDTTSASITALDRTWINENYYFAPFAPSSASSVKSIQVQTGNGTTADPSWETKADFVGTNGSASNTTDAFGDLTITHGLGVSDIAVSITPTGTTPYHTTVHTKTTTTFKIRFFDTSGAAVTSTAVTADWAARKN